MILTKDSTMHALGYRNTNECDNNKFGRIKKTHHIRTCAGPSEARRLGRLGRLEPPHFSGSEHYN